MAADRPSPTIILATRSEDKVREITQILAPVFRGRIITLAEAGVLPTPEEDDVEAFDTFLANAHAKAAFFLAMTGQPTMADDSGIAIDALGGAPGVRSRRFAAAPGVDGRALDQANNERVLRELAGVPADSRHARYVCAAVLHLPDSRRAAAVGIVSGRILQEPRGSGGFGYDPLFLDTHTGLSFGETDPVEKNRRSHRARAFRALAANLPSV